MIISDETLEVLGVTLKIIVKIKLKRSLSNSKKII